MIHPILTPRVNNNDDQVRFSQLLVAPGEAVRAGQEVAEVETDKASFAVEAERDGYFLKAVPAQGDLVDVGSVLLWIGDAPDEKVAESAKPEIRSAGESSTRQVTTKARLMMEEMGLDAAAISVSGDRLTVADVEAYLAAKKAPSQPAEHAVKETAPAEPGTMEALSMEERGMLRSVLWHRDVAAPAYLEISYDTAAWDDYAARYTERNRTLGTPFLHLMASHLARIAAAHPKANCVATGEQRFRYAHVNLGLTIQTGNTLYLVVVREAETLDETQFIKAVNRLHKGVIGGKLSVNELSGATIGFSSMARWNANRHIPILPPDCSLMVAHTVSRAGEGVLGATYDHRLLSGGDAIGILTSLSTPPANETRGV